MLHVSVVQMLLSSQSSSSTHWTLCEQLPQEHRLLHVLIFGGLSLHGSVLPGEQLIVATHTPEGAPQQASLTHCPWSVQLWPFGAPQSLWQYVGWPYRSSPRPVSHARLPQYADVQSSQGGNWLVSPVSQMPSPSHAAETSVGTISNRLKNGSAHLHLMGYSLWVMFLNVIGLFSYSTSDCGSGRGGPLVDRHRAQDGS